MSQRGPFTFDKRTQLRFVIYPTYMTQLRFDHVSCGKRSPLRHGTPWYTVTYYNGAAQQIAIRMQVLLHNINAKSRARYILDVFRINFRTFSMLFRHAMFFFTGYNRVPCLRSDRIPTIISSASPRPLSNLQVSASLRPCKLRYTVTSSTCNPSLLKHSQGFAA